jgi:hypothetical protein
MGHMRKIETDPEVLVFAITDAINLYVREVLIPRGIVSKDAWDDDELLRLKYEVADTVANNWAVSWRNDDIVRSDEATGNS